MGLINLAEYLRNVSEACKIKGFSRDSYYQFKELLISPSLTSARLNVRALSFQSVDAADAIIREVKPVHEHVDVEMIKLNIRETS